MMEKNFDTEFGGAVLAGTNANARATNVLRIEQIPHA